MLAQIMRYKQGIAVAGTHGKTTTSSLITHLMITGQMKPSAIVGGVMNNYETNSILGSSDWIVAEADESDGSFLRLNKMISVVTSMDPEHLDYYGSAEQMNLAYMHFLQTTSFYGFCVVCTDHPVVKETIKKVKYRKIISYGLNEDAFIQAKNIQIKSGELKFDIKVGDKTYSDFVLPMFGRHNILNALAAFAVVYNCGMDIEKIKAGFKSFTGVQRRFTKRGCIDGISIYDDYGHHPEEIKATLNAAKEATPDNKVIAVFQPHRYSRFSDLMDEFVSSFDKLLSSNFFIISNFLLVNLSLL
jgi:UDP-N-acetylmuramate--alanine ligase